MKPNIQALSKEFCELAGESPEARLRRLACARSKRYRDSHRKECSEYNKKWRQEHPENIKKSSKKHYLNNRDQCHAHTRIWKAKKAGIITKPGCCSECGYVTADLHAHHDDYRKRLSVRWLCRYCHFKLHRTTTVA